MKKLPIGVSRYEELIEDNYYYVDKTQYIEKLENLNNKKIIFLRPRKFGKTLFTSTLENYYDILKENKFDNLFKETYIGKNPTKLRNSYHILKFNFSGIDTNTIESTIGGFKEKVETSIKRFIHDYKIDFYINKEQSVEGLLNSLFEAFRYQKKNEKIYVIIDEYDHFANELLGFHTDKFKNLVSKNGKVRKWYEILKKGTETVVDRIFITGVAPITLDSLTSGFNIATDMTQNENFNEMIGFTQEELIKIMDNQEISKESEQQLLPIMKENYDGYAFCINPKQKIYNSNMCLYFLNAYIEQNRLPSNLVDVNIASDYSKLQGMLRLCQGNKLLEIIEKSIEGEGITSIIKNKFNPEMPFEEVELISMLYYLGYLTISGENLGRPILKIPNLVMKEIYSDYFFKTISEQAELILKESDYDKILSEIALKGEIKTITDTLSMYLQKLSNRDYRNFDEKYVKIIFYCLAMKLNLIYTVKSEMEIDGKYTDILIYPRDRKQDYYSILIEFKYLKDENKDKLLQKQTEAIKQVIKYANYDEIKDLKKIRIYTIVVVGKEVFIEEVNI